MRLSLNWRDETLVDELLLKSEAVANCLKLISILTYATSLLVEEL